MQKNNQLSGKSLLIFRTVFYFCSVYFLFMGTGLVFFPHLLLNGVEGSVVHPAIIGMLRGAGGAIIPYSLLYILTAREPVNRKWGLYVIAVANGVAIILDICSVLLNEYQWSQAIIDLPVEMVSLFAVFMVWIKIRKDPLN